MGDYSSTFSIHNKLEVDLVASKNGDPDHGYWLRWPNGGKIDLLSTSDQFQVKDRLGPAGTEAKIWITGKRPDTGKEFKIGLHVACPVSGSNVALIWFATDDPNVLISIGGFAPGGNPMILDVIIDRRI